MYDGSLAIRPGHPDRVVASDGSGAASSTCASVRREKFANRGLRPLLEQMGTRESPVQKRSSGDYSREVAGIMSNDGQTGLCGPTLSLSMISISSVLWHYPHANQMPDDCLVLGRASFRSKMTFLASVVCTLLHALDSFGQSLSTLYHVLAPLSRLSDCSQAEILRHNKSYMTLAWSIIGPHGPGHELCVEGFSSDMHQAIIATSWGSHSVSLSSTCAPAPPSPLRRHQEVSMFLADADIGSKAVQP